MNPEEVVDIMRHTLWVTLEVAAPFLLLSLVVGFLISLVQSLTQIQEFTLSFVPKMILMATALAIFFPWVMKIMTKFTLSLLVDEWGRVYEWIH